jgi:predicted hotdog family 3-hydroxylacyl-ACP dehydratase
MFEDPKISGGPGRDFPPGPIEHDELIPLLPHKGKMFLLSRVTAYDFTKRGLTAEYDITGDCLFYDEEAGGVPCWVGFELIAQSISALTGINSRREGKPPKVGFILSVSNMVLNIPVLQAGTTVTITIEEDHNMIPIFVFNGTLFQEQKPVMRAKLMVMETDDFSVIDTQAGGV